MKHSYLAEAVADFENAVVFYETQEDGLGARFILEFDELLATVLEFPRLGARVAETPSQLEVRRCVVQTFGVELGGLHLENLAEDANGLGVACHFRDSKDSEESKRSNRSEVDAQDR